MPLQSLFDRSPVLPVDVSISLARYLHSVRATHKQALASERSGDLKRAGLLHIRVLQLVCKTLPTHPDYSLPENIHVVRKLRAIAHAGFRDIDRVAAALTSKPPAAPLQPSPEPSPEPSPQPSPPTSTTYTLEVAGALVDLFERIATENTRRTVATTAILAGPGPVTDDGDDDDTQPSPPLQITALIIPSQSSGSRWSNVRYEHDVDQLLSIKKLRVQGLIAVSPLEDTPHLPREAKQALSVVQARFANGFALIIAGTAGANVARHDRTGVFRLPETEPNEDDEGELEDQGGGRVGDVQIRDDGHPAFKLYDLRPLAAARDGKQAEVQGKASLRPH